MPNWCVTNLILQGGKEDIERFCSTVNSCLDKPDVEENRFGKLWLGNVCEAFGYDHTKTEGIRGVINPDFYAFACLGGPDEYMDRLEPEETRDDDCPYTVRFSTETAWAPSTWLEDLLYEQFPNIEYGYRTTDDCGNFHQVRNPVLMDTLKYEISYRNYNDGKKDFDFSADDGEEEKITRKLKDMLGIEFKAEDIREQNDDFYDILNTFNEENEDDMELEITIWDEV